MMISLRQKVRMNFLFLKFRTLSYRDNTLILEKEGGKTLKLRTSFSMACRRFWSISKEIMSLSICMLSRGSLNFMQEIGQTITLRQSSYSRSIRARESKICLRKTIRPLLQIGIPSSNLFTTPKIDIIRNSRAKTNPIKSILHSTLTSQQPLKRKIKLKSRLLSRKT